VYSLCALLGLSEHLERKRFLYPGGRLVGLDRGLAMVPLSEALLREIQRSSPVETGGPSEVVEALEFLTPAVELWARELSLGSAVAYIETEYFGGEGYQRAAVWSEGGLHLGPLDGAGSINRALRVLGVEAPPGQEEFDAVGLGRHRSLEAWLSEA
jgi:hypothetical protein